MRSFQSAGGAGVSTSTLGKCSAGQKGPARELFPRRRDLISEAEAIGNSVLIIDARDDRQAASINGDAGLLQGFLDSCLGQRGNDFESCGVWMQAVIGEIFLHHALVIHKNREIIDVHDVVRGAVVFDPLV